jgi:hypothetical protein
VPFPICVNDQRKAQRQKRPRWGLLDHLTGVKVGGWSMAAFSLWGQQSFYNPPPLEKVLNAS